MDNLLILIVGIVVLANLAYTIWSVISMRRIFQGLSSNSSNDRFLFEQFIHTRSSLNLLYASIAIITFVLGFFGFNLQKNVTAEVKEEITRAARVDLDSLKAKSADISFLQSDARNQIEDIRTIRDQARIMFNNLQRTPQRLYVVEAVPIDQKKHIYKYSELQPAGGMKFPTFQRPPIAIWFAYPSPGDRSTDIGTVITPSTEGISAFAYEDPYVVDIWLFVK